MTAFREFKDFQGRDFFGELVELEDDLPEPSYWVWGMVSLAASGVWKFVEPGSSRCEVLSAVVVSGAVWVYQYWEEWRILREIDEVVSDYYKHCKEMSMCEIDKWVEFDELELS